VDAVPSEETLVRARAGDGEAFRELTDPYRRELQLHCYRMLGSLQDAEDLLQETLLAAWRGLDRFQGRASLRAWLHRIATNRCLNALRDRGRRPQRLAPSVALPEPSSWDEPVRLEPYPDILLEGLPDHAPGPEARYQAKEATELAFIAALQHLPPRQRAVLVLRDVLGYGTAEIAHMLAASQPSVKGAPAAPVPGSCGDRRVPARPGDRAWRSPACSGHPRQHPARVRLLPARAARRDRARLWAARAHAGG
jgi:RNA polymerase sigma-70 factor (TIGR02960 family)